MFHFPRCRLAGLCIQPEIAPHDGCGVAPFGNLRIKVCLPLPGAYRSLPRPSSPRDAKASIVCPYTLGRRSKPSPSRYVAILLPRLCSCQRATPPERGNPIVRRDSQGLVGVPGVEPGTSSLSGTRSNQLSYTPFKVGGGRRVRTDDIQLAKLALYQLSYTPSAVRPAPKTAS